MSALNNDEFDNANKEVDQFLMMIMQKNESVRLFIMDLRRQPLQLIIAKNSQLQLVTSEN